MDKAETANNQACIKSILARVAEAHMATLVSGFYGKVEISWLVKDGSIQQDLSVKVEQVKRMGPSNSQ